jgi:hypothetical protein
MGEFWGRMQAAAHAVQLLRIYWDEHAPDCDSSDTRHVLLHGLAAKYSAYYYILCNLALATNALQVCVTCHVFLSLTLPVTATISWSFIGLLVSATHLDDATAHSTPCSCCSNIFSMPTLQFAHGCTTSS